MKKLLELYRSLGIVILNTIVFVIAMNLLLALLFLVKDTVKPDKNTPPPPGVIVAGTYRPVVLEKIYPGFKSGTLDTLFYETRNRRLKFEPFTHFQESPMQGRFVNVDSAGFRLGKNQAPWPPDKSRPIVYIFGSSTTFGYAIPDSNTVASYIQQVLGSDYNLDVQLYNFGRGHYYSTLERILLQKLISQGYPPDIAIFIGGLNGCFYNGKESQPEDLPYNYQVLQEAVNNTPSDHSVLQSFGPLFSNTAIGRMAKVIRVRTNPPDWATRRSGVESLDLYHYTTFAEYNRPDRLAFIQNRYLNNKRMSEAVCREFGIEPIFVWQPSPTYKYDLQYHEYVFPDTVKTFWNFCYGFYLYPMMAEYVRQNPQGNNFIWAADIQEGVKEPLYCDNVHYTGAFSRTLAKFIVDEAVKRNLIRPKQTVMGAK